MNDHACDIIKVTSINLGAVVLSFAAVEAFFRIAAPAAAFIYTILKIWDWFKGKG